MSEAVVKHWAEDKHVAKWDSGLDDDEREVRTYFVVCDDGGTVTRTTGTIWRCSGCRVRMKMVFRPREYANPEDIPLVRRGADAELVGFFDEVSRGSLRSEKSGGL